MADPLLLHIGTAWGEQVKIIVDRVRAAYDKKPESAIQLENARQHGFGFVRALAAAGLVTVAGKADLMELLLYPRSSC